MSELITKAVIKDVRFSYLNIWEPRAMEEGQIPKYSASIIIPKSNKEAIAKVKAAIRAATQAGLAKLGGKVPANLKTPLRDGDIDRPDDPAYKNSMFINASSHFAPWVVDSACNPVLDKEEFYSGCYGAVSINFYAYNTNVSKGIAAGLNNLMKTRDGESLTGRMRADEDFADLEFDYDDEENFLS